MLKCGSLSICLVSALLWTAVSALAVRPQDPSAQQQERPKFYSPHWGQFDVEGSPDPRVVAILRRGAGPHRHAEYSVFELVDEGMRLRYRAQTVLRNEYVPWVSCVVNARFLVTEDDRGQGFGTTDNCLVVYDLVRGMSASWRLEDMVPDQVAESVQYWSAVADVDPVRQIYYPSPPSSCRREGYPFLTVDLPSLSVEYSPVPPEHLPAEVVDDIRTRVAMHWTWSMGHSEVKEPDWDTGFALPGYLKGIVRKPEMMGPLGVTEETVYFKYDDASGDYLRCDAEAWADPPESWGQLESDRTDSGK